MCCVVVCDLETSRMGAPYIYDISRLRVKSKSTTQALKQKQEVTLGSYEHNLLIPDSVLLWPG